MAAAWQALRELDREFALALLFAPPRHRETLSNLAMIACEAENAIAVASEPMLAAIRLQWWVEAIESGNTGNVPLAARLLAEIDNKAVSRQALIDLIGLWQDRLSSDDDDRYSCWSGLTALMMTVVSDEPDTELLDIATRVAHAQLSDHSHLTNDDLYQLDNSAYRWLLMLALTSLCRQRGGMADVRVAVWGRPPEDQLI